MGFFSDVVKVAAPIVGGAVGWVATGFNPAGAAAGFAAGSALSSGLEGKEAAESEQDAAKEERRLAALQNRRARLSMIRDAQLAQATSLVAGEASGIGLESSTRQGALSSIKSQVKGNLLYNQRGGELQARIFDDQRDAAKARTRQSLYAGAAQIASSVGTIIPSGGGAGIPTGTGTGPSTATQQGYYSNPNNLFPKS